ncbi:MAG: hypothetical protein QNJ54_35140 [Prochloraceae cyanobacterium]|nr:hypothetical protein [Prochloraceae cyanobacterium]
MSWEYFSPQNPCPICDGISSNCRKPKNSDITLCHQFIDTESGRRGYKLIKPTADRIWGIHVLDDGKKGSWQQRVGKYNSKRDLTEIRSSVREKKTKRLKQSHFLSIEERSLHNRLMLQSLILDDDHQKSLRVRGLSERALEDRLLRSVRNCLFLPDSIDPKLPGVSIDRDGKKRLSLSGRGISCPAFSPLGLITGAIKNSCWGSGSWRIRKRPLLLTKRFSMKKIDRNYI